MAFVRVILGIVGFGLLVVALLEFTIWVRGTSQPQRVTVADLTSADSISSFHVTVTDPGFLEDYIQGGITESSPTEAWFPVFIQNEDGTIDAPVRPLIAHVEGLRDDPDRVNEILSRSELTGILQHHQSHLSEKEKEHLQEIILDGNIEHAIVLSVDQPFPSLASLLGYTLGGCLLMGICLWLSLKAPKQPPEEMDLPSMSQYKGADQWSR